MNERQWLKQIRADIQAAKWDDAATLVIGTSCYIVSEVNEYTMPDRVPCVLLEVGNATPDADAPQYLKEATATVLVAQEVEGDPMGGAAVVGGSRSGGANSSKGRGVLEIEPQLASAVSQLTGADGAPIVVTAADHASVTIGEGGAVATRALTLKALCYVAPHYDPVQELQASIDGGGDTTLSWLTPSSRHDFVEVTIRRASGATAPASATAGTGVYTGSLSTFLDSPGAGQFSYAAFAGYTDTEGSTTETWSAQVVGSTRTVTVT